MNYFASDTESPENSIENQFESYSLNKIRANSPIKKHLWAIFQAGFYNTQFDSSALIKGTVDEALKINNTLRSILSIFIILGLLGTLLGLSSSLAELAPLSRDTLQNNEAIRESLKNLLNELKSAFAPSVWGVGFTILGVLLFAIYYYRCNTFSSVLERETLTNWVTQLIRPPARTLIETIAENERQMRKNLETADKNIKAAERFANSIGFVEDQSGVFQKNLTDANQSIETFKESAGNLSRFSENFIDAAQRFAQFDAKMEKLFQDIQNKSNEFQERILMSFNASQNFQNLISENIAVQHKELNAIIQMLQSKEQGYSEFRQKIDAQLQILIKNLNEVSGEAGNTFKLLGTRNQEIADVLAKEVGEPLKNDVGEKLAGVTNELQSRLTEIYNWMKSLDKPFAEVAKQFSGTYTNFDRGTERLAVSLKNEFIEQNRKNEEKLNNIQKLNPRIAELLDKLNQVGDFQARQNNTLAENLVTLTDSVAMLSRQVLNLNGAIQNMPRTNPAAVTVPVIRQSRPKIENENVTASGDDEPVFKSKKQAYKGSRKQQEDTFIAQIKRIISLGRWK